MIPIDTAHLKEGNNIIKLARAQGDKDTRFVLINVVEDIPGWVTAQLPSNVIDKSKQYAHDQLKTLAKGIKNKVDIDVRIGSAYRSILEAAEDMEVDLIIIASHKPGVQDYFLGSTAAKVVRHARCSVLVVR